MILFTKPKTSAGQGYLRIDKNLWFYDPSVGKWERRTERERIGGTNSRRSDFDESRLAEEYDPDRRGRGEAGRLHGAQAAAEGQAGARSGVPDDQALDRQGHRRTCSSARSSRSRAGCCARRTTRSGRRSTASRRRRDVWYPEEIRFFDEVEKANSDADPDQGGRPAARSSREPVHQGLAREQEPMTRGSGAAVALALALPRGPARRGRRPARASQRAGHLRRRAAGASAAGARGHAGAAPAAPARRRCAPGSPSRPRRSRRPPAPRPPASARRHRARSGRARRPRRRGPAPRPTTRRPTTRCRSAASSTCARRRTALQGQTPRRVDAVRAHPARRVPRRPPEPARARLRPRAHELRPDRAAAGRHGHAPRLDRTAMGALAGGSATGFTTFSTGARARRRCSTRCGCASTSRERVFVTAGKQHVRWGTGRFWQPTDYLHPRQAQPARRVRRAPGRRRC